MSDSPGLNCIAQKFGRVYIDLVEKALIKPDYVKRYGLASKNSLHGILQYVLIKTGIDCGYISVPEYKVQLSKPIDKSKIDPRFEEKARRKGKHLRKQRQLSVDVAFFRNSRLEGLAEIYTLDEIHGCLPSESLKNPWITPYHKLNKLVEETSNKIEFMVLVNLFPVTIKKEKLPWEDSRQHSVQEWKILWKNLAVELENRGLAVMLIGIDEDGITLLHHQK